jgi:hypothetical protein
VKTTHHKAVWLSDLDYVPPPQDDGEAGHGQ